MSGRLRFHLFEFFLGFIQLALCPEQQAHLADGLQRARVSGAQHASARGQRSLLLPLGRGVQPKIPIARCQHLPRPNLRHFVRASFKYAIGF